MEKGTLHLLDTPGFDDTHKSEAEVLREIAGYLSFAYKHKIRLSGIIYLHRITDIKLGGSALRNLHMFKKLCGEESLGSVVLVTSWWNQVDPAVGKNREKQLMTTKEFWGGMIDNGSKVIQHDGSQQSAKSVVKYLAEKSKPIVLDIQRQMVEEQKTLDQTGAGLEIGGELLRQRQRYEEEIKLAQQDIKDAIKQKDEESAAQIKKTEQEFYAKIKKVEEDQEALRVTHEEARRQQEQENRRKREELRQKLHDVEIATLKIEHDSKLKRVELELKHKDEMAQRADRDRQRDSDWYQAELKRASQPGCVVSWALKRWCRSRYLGWRDSPVRWLTSVNVLEYFQDTCMSPYPTQTCSHIGLASGEFVASSVPSTSIQQHVVPWLLSTTSGERMFRMS